MVKLKDFQVGPKVGPGFNRSQKDHDERDHYLNLLFDEGEGICFGTKYDTAVVDVKYAKSRYMDFISINPLDLEVDHMWIMDEERFSKDKPRRCDWNITCFRNFMFEMDNTPLNQQKEILETCGIEWATVVFSGGKSYHAILSIEGGLDTPVASIPGLDFYNLMWRRIAAKINDHANKYYDTDSKVYVDTSCKNPSRFSRFPNALRSDKQTLQHVAYLGRRISREEFSNLIEICPYIPPIDRTKFNTPENLTTSEEDFFEIASNGLANKIKYVTWGASAGMYFEIYRLTLWAIDDTNIDRDTFLEVLWNHTFPQLIDIYNYPREKCEIGVYHAFSKKFPGVYSGIR